MTNEYLKIIFYKRLSKYTDNAKLINSTFAELLELYSDDRRHYHDLTHIISLLNQFETIKGELTDEDVVYIAIWFHDAVFDTWKSDSEDRSAAFAQEFLQQTKMPPSRIAKVVNYILATKTHEPNGEGDLDYFLDLDLSILGAEETIYDVYTRQIKDEYHLIPGFIYNRGRRKILRGIIERPNIYRTTFFRTKLEMQARQNIERELANL